MSVCSCRWRDRWRHTCCCSPPRHHMRRCQDTHRRDLAPQGSTCNSLRLSTGRTTRTCRRRRCRSNTHPRIHRSSTHLPQNRSPHLPPCIDLHRRTRCPRGIRPAGPDPVESACTRPRFPTGRTTRMYPRRRYCSRTHPCTLRSDTRHLPRMSPRRPLCTDLHRHTRYPGNIRPLGPGLVRVGCRALRFPIDRTTRTYPRTRCHSSTHPRSFRSCIPPATSTSDQCSSCALP